MAVAPAALAAAGEDMALVIRQIRQNPPGGGVFDQGAVGHMDHAVLPPAAVAAPAPAGLAVCRRILSLIAEIGQRGHIGIHHKYHVTAAAAVAAVRPAGSHKFLPVERHGPVSTGARFDKDFCHIDKHALSPFFSALARHDAQ